MRAELELENQFREPGSSAPVPTSVNFNRYIIPGSKSFVELAFRLRFLVWRHSVSARLVAAICFLRIQCPSAVG